MKQGLIFAIIVCAVGASLRAQELIPSRQNRLLQDSILVETFDPVVISATRTKRQLSSLPFPTQLIDKQEIGAIHSMRLTDLLNEQTGLVTVSDFGGGQGIQMQGLDSQYTLILVNGLPLVGRSAGTLDLSRISVGNIRQVEIVKGASSSLYGNEALGGVINIITDTPHKGTHGSLNYRGGSNNTHDLSAQLSLKKDKHSFQAYANHFQSDGYDLTDSDETQTVEPFDKTTANLDWSYNYSEQTTILVNTRLYRQRQDYTASALLKGASRIDEWNGMLKIDHTTNNQWTSSLEWYTTRYFAQEYLNESTGALFYDSDFDQLFSRPELRTTYTPSDKTTVVAGAGLTYQRLERTDFLGTPEFYSPYAYVQYDRMISDKINVIAGARFDQHNEYASQFSPKLALRYMLSPKTSVKGSVGYGFKTPDFRQLYFDFTNATAGYTVLGYNAVATRLPELDALGQLLSITVPLSEFDSPLKPERSIAFNLGADFKPLRGLKIETNLFRNDINNLIDTRVIAKKTNGQNVFSYYNVRRVYTYGTELNMSYKINAQLKFSAGYQLLYAKDKAAEKVFANGEVFARINPSSPSFRLQTDDYLGLLNRSRHTANAKLFYRWERYKLDANIRGTYRSSFGLFDTNGNTYLDQYDALVSGFSVWDFALNKTIAKGYTLGFGLDNLFDFTDPTNLTNVPGRLIYGTLSINL